MAGKSLLHQFGWHTGKYEIAKEAILSGKKRGPMEGSFRKQGSSDREPPPKKRRTEDDDDPWGDDSMEFTQADLHDIEDIELQASQAVTLRPEVVVPGPAVPTQGQVSGASGTFVKPQLSRSSSSSISSGSRGGNRSISNGSSHSAQNSMNQSHSSTGSHSHSSYPSSLSNYSSSSSTSVKSGSSTESFPDQSGSMSRPSTGSLDLSTSISVESQSATSEIVKMKQECAALKLQLENMKQEVCVKEGENRLLRDNLNKKDVELDTLKMEKINKIYQQNTQQSEKEKQLQNDLARLQTQLQFKDQEERELSSRIKDLESQLRNQQAAGPSASQAYPQQSGSVSPKPRKVQVEERSPKGSGGFPSKRTFMAAEGSPQKVKMKVMQGGDNMMGMGPDSSQNVCQMLARDRQISHLKVPATGCPRTGSHIVGRLLDLPPSVSGTISERGILGLLNTPCTSTSLYNVQFDRDKDTSLLSPVKSRRISDLHSLVTQQDKPELISLVPVDHFNMAVQGLSNLLKADNQSISSSLSNFSGASRLRQLESSGDNLAITSERLLILEDAILVLPLISDYLKHYTDMLEATFETSTSLTTSSSSPESFDTSSESPTGSLGVFLKTTANFANDLESLAVASLNTLLELVSCEGVRRILLDLENCQMSQITQAGVQPMDIESSGSETDLPMKDAASRLTHIPRKYIIKLNILQKVIKLSNPGTKERLYNARIVTTCLNILTLLANSADEQHITCLMPVLCEESLQNCVDHEADVTMVTHGLQLFRSLVRSNQVVSSLCSNTTGCVLMTVYSASLTERWQAAPVCSQLHIASLIVDSILYLASSHKGCFTLILESDCRCSSEAVKSIVTILHSVMQIYQKYKSNKQTVSKPDEHTDPNQEAISEDSLRKQEEAYIETSQRILQTGLQLLHLIYQFDSGFMNRHIPVQHKYVQLICGLTHMFRPIENNDSEMNALQDLWDFNQDDSELSQDSESDDQEVMDS